MMSFEMKVVDEANDLARAFYALLGNTVRDGYCFEMAKHPQERLMWQMAVVAFERLRQTDVEACLAETTGGDPE